MTAIPAIPLWTRDDWDIPCHVQDPAGLAVSLVGSIIGAELWLAGYSIFQPLTVSNGGIVRVADANGDFRVVVSRQLTARALATPEASNDNDRTRILIYKVDTLGVRKTIGVVVADVFDVFDPRLIGTQPAVTIISQTAAFTIVMASVQGAPGPSSIPAAQISDGTTTGRALLKAVDVAAVRQLLGIRAPLRRAVSDTHYAVQLVDTHVGYAALTAPRNVTLPAASEYPAGAPLSIADETGLCSTVTPIVVKAAGADTIQGQPDFTIASPFQMTSLISNGANLWTL